MTKKSSEPDRRVIMSDEYVKESGLQGGKVIGEHLVLSSLLFGIPFLVLGVIGLFMVFWLETIAPNTANIILVLLLTIIGLLFMVGAYNLYRTNRVK